MLALGLAGLEVEAATQSAVLSETLFSAFYVMPRAYSSGTVVLLVSGTGDQYFIELTP